MEERRRRFSRPELPSLGLLGKARRNSTAVAQLFSQGARRPSVVVEQTEDPLFPSFHPMAHSSSLERGEFTPPLSGGLGLTTTGLLSPSAPLLEGNISTIEHSHLSHHNNNNQGQGQSQGGQNGENIKPLARQFIRFKKAVFSKTARKLCCGLFLSVVVSLCWTLLFHAIKRAYLTMHLFPEDNVPIDQGPKTTPTPAPPHTNEGVFDPNKFFQSFETDQSEGETKTNSSHLSGAKGMRLRKVYEAPFFTAWILTIVTLLFYPIHQITVRFCSCMGRKGPQRMSRAVSDAINGFRERGMTLFQFLGRCCMLCFLWLITNWLIAFSLKTLKATQVLTLYATTTSFLYLLSWVILHQQFVGLRILAVILSNVGIALFAYMDGQTYRSTTIVGVIFGAASAATSAVFKVSLKKSFGYGATISQQVALIFSVVGLLSILLLWPLFLVFYFSGVETIEWSKVPWELILLALGAFLLVAMLENFGVTCTFEFFITIGLLLAIPFSAVLDYYLYNNEFDKMCLGGIIVIAVGFCVVLLPENWPDYITRLIRYLARLKDKSCCGKKKKGTSDEKEKKSNQTRTERYLRDRLNSPTTFQ